MVRTVRVVVDGPAALTAAGGGVAFVSGPGVAYLAAGSSLAGLGLAAR